METVDLIFLAVRLGFVLVLYLFLARIAAALWQDLRRTQTGRPGNTQTALGPHLLVLDPGQSALDRGQTLSLRGETTLGRELNNVIVLQDDTVSSRHALVTRDGRRWLLRDLGSTNGTFINERPVAGAVTLRSGDVIQIGRLSFRFEEK